VLKVGWIGLTRSLTIFRMPTAATVVKLVQMQAIVESAFNRFYLQLCKREAEGKAVSSVMSGTGSNKQQLSCDLMSADKSICIHARCF